MIILNRSYKHIQVVLVYITDQNLPILEKVVEKIFMIGGFP